MEQAKKALREWMNDQKPSLWCKRVGQSNNETETEIRDDRDDRDGDRDGGQEKGRESN